jgi:hypothetical protein
MVKPWQQKTVRLGISTMLPPAPLLRPLRVLHLSVMAYLKKLPLSKDKP